MPSTASMTVHTKWSAGTHSRSDGGIKNAWVSRPGESHPPALLLPSVAVGKRVASGAARTMPGMAPHFIECDREQAFLMPPSLRDWMPEDHLVWTVLEAVEEMDLSDFYAD